MLVCSWPASPTLSCPVCRILSRSVATCGRRFSSRTADYALYRDLLAERCRKAGVAPYCLMPNRVHLILAPAAADGLALALGETHRHYTGFVNARLRAAGFFDRLEARLGRTLRPGKRRWSL